MLRYIFAVIAAFSIYGLTVYGALSNRTPVNYCTATNCISLGITK